MEPKGQTPKAYKPGKQILEGGSPGTSSLEHRVPTPHVDSEQPPPGKEKEPAWSQQLHPFNDLSSSDPFHTLRTLTSARAPEGRSLTTSLSVRFPLIFWWEFSSIDTLSSENSHFTKWHNYAWSSPTASNSHRCDNSLLFQEKAPKSIFPQQSGLILPSLTGTSRLLATWSTHTEMGKSTGHMK